MNIKRIESGWYKVYEGGKQIAAIYRNDTREYNSFSGRTRKDGSWTLKTLDRKVEGLGSYRQAKLTLAQIIYG